MKQSLLSILLLLALLLSGCQRGSAGDPDDTSAQTDTQAPPSGRETPSDIDEDTAYLDIERYQPHEFSERLFAWEGDGDAFSMDLPDEWELSRNEGSGFVIKREGRTIGAMVPGEAGDEDEWTVLEITDNSYLGVSMQKFLEKQGSGETLAFRCRFVYEYETDEGDRTITLTARYDEVADFTSSKLMVTPELTRMQTDPCFGVLSDVSKGNLLFLGNSFIEYSQVGQILQEMLDVNGKTGAVQPISEGFATVNTFVNNWNRMTAIRQGYYDIVFICGFYNFNEINHLETLMQACEESDTTLVIFPAHNENAGVVSSACAQFSSLVCLNWKQEVEALIASGVDIWDLCVNDTYRHSTPLAGYVGAHMVYRALYGTVPAGKVSDYVDAFNADAVLGDYPETGCVGLVEPGEVLFWE